MKCTPQSLVYLPSIVKSFTIAFATSSQGYQMEAIRYVDFLVFGRGTHFFQNICTLDIEVFMSLLYLHLQLAIPVATSINLGLIEKYHLYTTTLPPSHDSTTYLDQLGLHPFRASTKTIYTSIIEDYTNLLISYEFFPRKRFQAFLSHHYFCMQTNLRKAMSISF